MSGICLQTLRFVSSSGHSSQVPTPGRSSSECFDFFQSSALFFSLVHVYNCVVGIFDVVTIFLLNN